LHPDLVTLDVVMAGESGLDVLRQIIGLDRNANVLMVTATGKQSMIIEAIQAGAKGFLIKPFEPHAVVAEVKTILKG
jgi:two-component system, chemotaxis family, chemotaxis protein CheY